MNDMNTDGYPAMALRAQLREGEVKFPSNQAITEITDDRLMKFVAFFRKAVPREIRNMVYKRLYHSMNFDDILRVGGMMDGYRAASSGKSIPQDIALPRFFNKELCDSAFIQELVATVYEEHRRLRIRGLDAIGDVLNYDFFRIGVRLNMCVLSKLEISIKLATYTSFSALYSIPQHFVPLLVAGQTLAPGFKLAILLTTRPIAQWRRRPHFPSDKLSEAMAAIDNLELVLKKLKSVYAQLRKKCRADIVTKLRNNGSAIEWILDELCMQRDWDDLMAYLKVTRGLPLEEINTRC
jgi:hypothetical protein